MRLDLFELRAGDDVEEDLRNRVWRGTVVGAAPGDVMLHVPCDQRVEAANDRVALFASYHIGGLAMVVDPARQGAAADLPRLKTAKAAVAYRPRRARHRRDDPEGRFDPRLGADQ